MSAPKFCTSIPPGFALERSSPSVLLILCFCALAFGRVCAEDCCARRRVDSPVVGCVVGQLRRAPGAGGAVCPVCCELCRVCRTCGRSARCCGDASITKSISFRRAPHTTPKYSHRHTARTRRTPRHTHVTPIHDRYTPRGAFMEVVSELHAHDNMHMLSCACATCSMPQQN